MVWYWPTGVRSIIIKLKTGQVRIGPSIYREYGSVTETTQDFAIPRYYNINFVFLKVYLSW